MSNHRPGEHFNQIETARGSAFSSRFPVDQSRKQVREIVQTKLPQTFDSIFLTRGSTESFQTTRKGAIGLAPLIARNRAHESSDEHGSEFEAKQFVFRSLTDSNQFQIAQLSLDRVAGLVTDFSMVVDTGIANSNSRYYELCGFLGSVADEAVFEVSRIDAERGPERLATISRSVATDFVAAVNLQHGEPEASGTIETMLVDLMDSSANKTHTQSGEYSVCHPDGTELKVAVSREEIIRHGIAKTAAYSIQMDQEGIVDPTTGSSTSITFDLDYVRGRSPSHQATLGSLLLDPDEVIPKWKRASQYEELSCELRNKPEIIFEALYQAAVDLADYS